MAFWRTGNKNTAPTATAEPTQPLLPFDVNYALSHRQGQLAPPDVAKLFRNGLQHLGFYVAMRASASSDEIQMGLLARAAAYKFDMSRLVASDARDALSHLESQNPPTVESKKLHPVGRLFGVQTWNAHFPEVIKPALEAQPDSTIFMVANAPYVGLDELAALSLHRGRALGILKPGRLDQTELPVGFMLEPTATGTDIRPLPHDFERPDNAIVFDDAIGTGAGRDQVMEFWGADPVPRFLTAFAVDGGW